MDVTAVSKLVHGTALHNPTTHQNYNLAKLC